MRTIIHVNQHAVRRKDERCITVKQGKKNTYAREVTVHGPSRVVYRPEKPLSCGAKVWVETEAPVEIIDAAPPPVVQKVVQERVKPKQGRERDNTHLAFVRRLPCTLCRAEGGVDAAHVRFGSLSYGKPHTGMGMKPDDKWTVPLCRGCHTTQHKQNEKAFWDGNGINVLQLALSLYENSGDELSGRVALEFT